MVRRVAATQATLDRFKDKPLKLGTNDCVRMAAMHLRRLGYKVRMPVSGSYRTLNSAIKMLKEYGFADVAEALDAQGLPRISPAAAVVGDIVMLPGTDKLGALAVSVGNGRCVGFHEATVGATVLQPLEFVAAWRVEPR